jgi:4,5-dihydroxyphthalate decarboxylase
MVAMRHDCLAPIERGDVSVPGLELSIDHSNSIASVPEELFDASEISLSRYLMLVDKSDTRYIGLPFFLMRGFRQRAVLCRTGSPLTSLSDLRGRRVGVSSWADTGYTWTRAAIADAGVDISEISWVSAPSRRASDPPIPPHVEVSADPVLDQLLDGRLDAILAADIPAGYVGPGSPIRRVVSDYAAVEYEYFARSGIYPAFHVVVLNRNHYEQDPSILPRLYRLLVAGWESWQVSTRAFSDLGPYLQASIESTPGYLGDGWQQHGIDSAANQRMLAAMNRAQISQGLTARGVDPVEMFPEFAAAAGAEPSQRVDA